MTETRSDALIVFTPSGKRGRFALGTPVLTAARTLGVDIDSVAMFSVPQLGQRISREAA